MAAALLLAAGSGCWAAWCWRVGGRRRRRPSGRSTAWPAGGWCSCPPALVLHDLQALGDPVLFPRTSVAALGPRPTGDADAGVLDLTLGTVGLALQLDLREPLRGDARDRAAGRWTSWTSGRLRFAPARPGAVLAEARRRRIGVVTPAR